MTQAPPQDHEAERAVLADVLLKPDALGEISGWLVSDDFCVPEHRWIYAAAVAADEVGETPDVVSVAARLRVKGQLNSIGGSPYLATLLDTTPATGNLVTHARVVAGLSRIRRLQRVCRGVVVDGYGVSGGNAATWLTESEGKLCEAAQFAEARETMSTLREMVMAEERAISERRESQSALPGISTGFRGLDRAINGLRRGVKYDLGAVPGAGKTALALQIAVNVAREGLGVVFVSIEMPRDQLVQRAISQHSGVDTQLIERGELTDDQWAKAVVAFKHLGALPMVVDDAETQTATGVRSTVRKGVRRLRQEFGGAADLGLIVVDHLHIQTPDAIHGKSRNDELAALSNANRKLAKEFNCPVLELIQLNRAAVANPNEIPHLRHARESGAIDADAFGTFMLHRKDVFVDDPKKWDGEASLAIRKLRQGGRLGVVPFKFLAPAVRFYEDADKAPPEDDYMPTPPDDCDSDYPPIADDFQTARAGE